jgi:hypothetical protein
VRIVRIRGFTQDIITDNYFLPPGTPDHSLAEGFGSALWGLKESIIRLL